MIRGLIHQLKRSLFLLIVLTLSVFWGSVSFSALASTPIARIYKGNQLYAEVISYGRPLGQGTSAFVREAIIRYPNGDEETIALKVFDPKKSSEDIALADKKWTKLEPVFAQDREKVLTHGTAGLKLVPVGEGAIIPESHVIITTKAESDAFTALPKLKLQQNAPAFEQRLATLLKFKRQALSGISLLSTNGFSHGDLKPGNVLYRVDKGFDWDAPDPSKIHFSLSDFDTVNDIGKLSSSHTDEYAPPEFIAKGRKRVTPAWDLYSHAVSVYTMVFGSWPYDDYFKLVHANDHLFVDDLTRKTEEILLFDDPHDYQKYLKFIDARFKALESQAASKSSLQGLNELHSFVLNGLKQSPSDRIQAFPEIAGKLSDYVKKMIAENDPRCEKVLPYLKKLLNEKMN